MKCLGQTALENKEQKSKIGFFVHVNFLRESEKSRCEKFLQSERNFLFTCGIFKAVL